MTIGRPQGAVWIGKPLDVVVPLSLGDAESAGGLCLEAEVVQGDLRIPDRSLTISLEPGRSAADSRMRIRSTVTIDEPVVNLNVRAGCETRSTRSYVLLADVPTEASLPSVAMPGQRPAAGTPAAVGAPQRSPSRVAGAGSSSGSEGAAPARRNAAAAAPAAGTHAGDAQPPRRSAAASPSRPAAAQPRPPEAPRASTPGAATAPATPARGAAPVGPRLQLESMEPAPTAAPGLKTTPQLTLPRAEDPARRSAAAAEWRVLSGEPEAAQREAQRMQALEATLTTLREQTAQNQRALLELRTELAQAREDRYRNPLVYALIGLLLLALIAILLLWRQIARRAEPAWWREPASTRDAGPTQPSALGELLDEDEGAGPSGRRRSANATSFGAATFADLGAENNSGFGDSQPHPRAVDSTPSRTVNTEELFDVQQQSDFFLSLGQHDQAIAVLREHIASNPGTSALAYLDLLRIYHSLERKDDYARLAEEFERVFNADVPAFEHFNETGKGLEHYRNTLARIESQWPAPGTLALIEELIFRKPGANEDEAFDLAAYQELLLLYSVAKEVIDPASASPAPVTQPAFVDTFGHEQLATTPAPLEARSQPEPVEDGPMLPDSIYGAIDDRLEHETVLVPDAPVSASVAPDHGSRRVVQPDASLDLAEFDKTAFETMRAPLETPTQPPAPSTDPHVIDFELFDPDTEAEIAPKPVKR
ncbi:type IV pilus assembly protein FimV [Variovorax sp. DT-64]|uniref:type IV pilus assembly protein FimV n=1 Tax=Variovorax sp. DT-64 TaxID=3396160 RepID=UPI003F1B8993